MSNYIYVMINGVLQEPLVSTMSEVMWRTLKRDVIEEINLPLQTEQVHWLDFSPVERHFYSRSVCVFSCIS